MFTKVLIANRGEIAVRIARACRALDITPVAVFSDADRTALHVRTCPEAYCIGPAPAAESYLRGDKLIEIALRAGCEAIHPGYGFLSENAAFARAVTAAGLVWIGPPPEAIELMGSKIESKRLAERAGVPIVPGYLGEDQSIEALAAQAGRIGYPVLIKASAGGGGKGMRVVRSADDMPESVAGAQREALGAFGDGTLLLEKYLTEPRHIEVQVLGDKHGSLIHLGERDCTIQRRHQKVFEEAPSPVVTPELRERITSSALALAKAAGYENAGTVEFIYEQGEYYFLEMNTRLQVEHPVTEEATGFDIVQAQIRIAAGEPLSVTQEQIRLHKHAMEARLYAEDPDAGFLPATGKVARLDWPPAARIDAGLSAGDTVTPYYDPMIAKVITSGSTRGEALAAMQNALGALRIEGVTTNLDFLRWLIAHPAFAEGHFSTGFIEEHFSPGARAPLPVPVAVAAGYVSLNATAHDKGSGPWRQARQALPSRIVIDGQLVEYLFSALPGDRTTFMVVVSVGGSTLFEGEARCLRSGAFVQVQLDSEGLMLSLPVQPSPTNARRDSDGSFEVEWNGRRYRVKAAPPLSTDNLNTSLHLAGEDTLASPMPGKVLKLFARAGDEVQEAQPLVIIEAMKMEFTVRAPHDGKVVRVHFEEGAQVAVGDVLVELEA